VTTRRQIVLAIGGVLAAPLMSIAQQKPARIYRIGILDGTATSSYRMEALLRGLRELGYVSGKNIVIEHRQAEGSYERLPGLAAELVGLKPDVIVVVSPPAIRVVQKATAAIPLIMTASGDPVGSRFVKSLARPGGNITGLSNQIVDLTIKHLELLQVAVPKLSRVAVLVNPGHPNHPDMLKNVRAAAKTAIVEVMPLQAATTSEIESAFGAMTRERATALIVLGDPLFFTQARRIADLAVQRRLPTMFWTREMVEAGGLMSYGQDIGEHFHRAATYVDKILRGAKPADLPVELATKIELVVNLKTAKAIGLTIPQNLLFRADKVIE
jgi:putative ABC transport system substrate-binding protein